MQDIPKFVLKRLQETADTESHPDADLLTAFAEQSLLESERLRVMEHLARCADCREVVALALPATEDLAVTTSASPTRSGWSGWTVLRWGIVAAAIVAITSVGILQYRHGHQKDETLDSVLVLRNKNSTAAELAVQPPSASSELQEIRPQTKNGGRTDTGKKTQSNRQDSLAEDNSARSLNQIFPAPRNSHAAGSGIGTGVGAGRAPTPAEVAPNPNVGQQAASSSSSQTVEVEPQAGAGAPTTETFSGQIVQDQKERPSTTVDAVRAPPRWSIDSDGKLLCSFDAGNTWVDIDPEPPASRSTVASIAGNTNAVAKADKKAKAQRSPHAGFRALAAFGTEVWAGGAAAMLYRSGDSGAHWTRVLPSSSGATLTGDITSIEFSDPQHGRIASSNGDVWITVDDGQTWRRQ